MVRDTEYNQVVAIVSNEVYVLQYTFSHGDAFKGAVGLLLGPVWREQYNDRTSQEGLEEVYEGLWRQDAGMSNGTTMGLREWVLDNIQDPDEVFDTTGEEHWNEARLVMGVSEDEVPVFDCIAAGRVFKESFLQHDFASGADIGDVLVAPYLMKIIADAEGLEYFTGGQDQVANTADTTTAEV